MIKNIWFKIVARKINKIPEYYTIFVQKMPYYIIRQRDWGQAKAKTSRLRPRPRPKFRGRGQNFGLEDLTSLPITPQLFANMKLLLLTAICLYR